MEHEEDCNGQNEYSDGLFMICLCRARLLNTFAGARYIHRRKGTRPSKVITLKAEPTI